MYIKRIAEEKYVLCPNCGGEGTVMEARLYPSGHTEIWVDCEFCYGYGQFEEADYIIMKLEGKV